MARLTGTRSGEQQLTGTLTTARMEVTVSVDSDTITGAPGSAASVENIGTDRDAILKFTIPRGDKGDTGNPGPAGQDGRDGQDGQDGANGTTFTPSVSNAGVISWTNDGGKQNPASVDLVSAVISALPTWNGGSY